LLTVINDILDFSKIEAHKLDLEEIDFDLRAMLEDTIDLFAIRAQEKNIEMTSDIAPGVPLRVRGDPGRLRQILSNLLGNAVKFTSHGEIALTVDSRRENDGRVLLNFAVRDTGIGIPEDKHAQMFLAFSQADTSVTRKYGGTGLGLAISKQLVDLMGGDIGFESIANQGTTFWFTVSLLKQQAPLAEMPILIDALSQFTDSRILVVDDNATNRHILASFLAQWGFRSEEAEGVLAGVQMLKRAVSVDDPYRLAIVDMSMPEMHGEDFGAIVKADAELAGTRLVMMTSAGQRGDGRRLHALGFSAYLSKPVKSQILHDTLLAVLSGPISCLTETVPLITRHSIKEQQRKAGRLLLVDDNYVNQKVAIALLKKLGYQDVTVAGNGVEAIDCLKNGKFDLVLMDCQMPILDGLAATRQIRAAQSGELDNKVAIVALTAHAMADQLQLCIDAGMDDYLVKPVQREELDRILSKWINLETLLEVPQRNEQQSGEPLSSEKILLSIKGMDMQAGLRHVDGDCDLYVLLLREFINSQRGDDAVLQQLYADLDWSAAERLVHSAKSTSQMLGFTAFTEVSRELEVLFKEAVLSPRAEELIPTFIKLHQSMVVEVEQALGLADQV
jgi:CheY-like chemotaxis protein